VRLFIKWISGLLLLPLAAAATLTFARQLQADLDWRALDLTTWWFAGGFTLWIILYFALPRPMWSYVLAHECTHALWGLLMGAKVSRMKVGERGGSVTLSKSNILITLAPYFFPFYTVITLLVFVVAAIWIDFSAYLPLWYALFGLTWAFHITFTLSILAIRQPDIMEHGRLFSYVIIYTINLLTAAALMNLLTDRPLAHLATELGQDIPAAYRFVWDQAQPLLAAIKTQWPLRPQ
jgi:hypothetical protein